MAGVKENIGVGRSQETQIDARSNIMLQKPENFADLVAGTDVSSDAAAIIGEPFVVSGTFDAHATVGTVVNAYTVPTGWKVRVLEVFVSPTSAVANTTIKVVNDTDDITDAVAFATDQAKAVFTTYNDVYDDVVAGEAVNLVCATGASRPAGRYHLWLMRVDA